VHHAACTSTTYAHTGNWNPERTCLKAAAHWNVQNLSISFNCHMVINLQQSNSFSGWTRNKRALTSREGCSKTRRNLLPETKTNLTTNIQIHVQLFAAIADSGPMTMTWNGERIQHAAHFIFISQGNPAISHRSLTSKFPSTIEMAYARNQNYVPTISRLTYNLCQNWHRNEGSVSRTL